jgi:hypothetical protein
MKAPKGSFLSGKRTFSLPAGANGGEVAPGNSDVQSFSSAKFPDTILAGVDSMPARPVLSLHAVAQAVMRARETVWQE